MGFAVLDSAGNTKVSPTFPLAHASSHAAAGSDPVTLTEAQITGLVADLAGKAALVHTHAQADVTGLVADLALKAALASPTFTGTPAAPTAGAGTNTTQIATTAFVAAGLALKTDATGVSIITSTGAQNALALPAGTGDLVIVANNASLLSIQGIVAGLDGQRLTVISKGAGQVDLYHNHASGTAAGKLKLFATTGITSLAAGSGVATFQYDATVTVWRLVAHEQGAWITPAFAAGDFLGGAPQVWTVDSGDVVSYKYRLSGRSLTVTWYLAATSVSGTPGPTLFLRAPTDFQASGYSLHMVLQNDNSAGNLSTYALLSPGGTQIQIAHSSGVGNWTAATNTTYVFGTITWEVT